MDTLMRYTELLKSHERKHGHNPGRLYIEGWKVTKKAEIRRMYRLNKAIPVKLALEYGLTNADHVAMLGACRSTEEIQARVIELVKAGVDIRKVKAGPGKGKGQPAQAKEKPRVVAVGFSVVKASAPAQAPVQVVAPQPTMTKEQRETAEALENHERHLRVKAALEKVAKKGHTPEISKEEEAAMLARHQAKPKPSF